ETALGNPSFVWWRVGYCQRIRIEWLSGLDRKSNDYFCWINHHRSYSITDCCHQLFNGDHLQYGNDRHVITSFGTHGRDRRCSPFYFNGWCYSSSIMCVYVTCGDTSQCGGFWVWVFADSRYGQQRFCDECDIYCDLDLICVFFVTDALGFDGGRYSRGFEAVEWNPENADITDHH